MDEGQEHGETQLFLVRVWADRASSENGRIQGKVLHVLSGKGNNFSDGATLLDLLLRMIPATHNDNDNEPIGEKGATQ